MTSYTTEPFISPLKLNDSANVVSRSNIFAKVHVSYQFLARKGMNHPDDQLSS